MHLIIIPAVGYFISSSLLSFVICVSLILVVSNLMLGYFHTAFDDALGAAATAFITYKLFAIFISAPTNFWVFFLLAIATSFIYRYITALFLTLRIKSKL